MHPVVFTVEPGHIGRGSPHVKTDEGLFDVRVEGGHCVADHSPCRTRQNGVASLETVRADQAAVRLHEQKIGTGIAKAVTKSIQVFPDVGGEVGIHAGGLTPIHNFDTRHGLRRKHDMRKTHLPGQFTNLNFMIRINIGMHQHDGQAFNPFCQKRFQIHADLFEIGRFQDFNPVSGNTGNRGGGGRRIIFLKDPDALVNFQDGFINRFGFFDFQIEQPWPVLFSDGEQVSESPGNEQTRPGSLFLQEGVGRDGGPHADPFDRGGIEIFHGQGPAREFFQNAPDPFDGGIGVMTGIFGKEFQHTITRLSRNFGVDIGKGSTAVN